MKILQLTSDWKWTGPAAPMLELATAQRAAGHDVVIACAPASPESEPSLIARAREAGFAPVLELERARGVHPLRDRADAARLRALLARQAFDVVHTWHTRDHVLALRARARLPRAARARVVRSYKLAEPIPRWPWNRWLFGPGTDALACVSEASATANRRLRGGRPVAAIYGAVDLARFAPAPADKAVRESLGLAPEHRVIGIAARAQRHRRFDLLLAALAALARRDPNARLVVIGRGTHIEETAVRPAAGLGIADRVIFAGYRTGDYADVLRCCDVFTFLVPGSDGSCRALLEAAACAIPAVTSRRGALPELVVDGETGILAEEEPDRLAASWQALLGDPRAGSGSHSASMGSMRRRRSRPTGARRARGRARPRRAAARGCRPATRARARAR
ncbi:MAG: glycosyltransferase family 4 protein [Deltaproteobacteria bacterium]|nr:MAG: glycosyltransferase family 4 protein [Deltaproteobacteria bacterium]